MYDLLLTSKKNYNENNKNLIFLFLCALNTDVQSRNIALDVSHKRIGQLNYVIQVRYFQKFTSAFDPDSISYYISVKSHPLHCRSNGLKDQYGSGKGEFIGLQKDSIILSIYRDTITMTGLGKYPIYVEVNNRIENICNIQNEKSNEFSEIATDTINVLDPSISGDQQGFLFNNTPVIYANNNDSIEFLPAYSNFIGDSIVYNITTPLSRSNSKTIDKISSYQFPDKYLPSPNNQISINTKTGKLKWKTPASCPCKISIALNGTEYQKGIKVSSFTRDLMLVFRNCPAKSNIINKVGN
jgi:hypothetical protein